METLNLCLAFEPCDHGGEATHTSHTHWLAFQVNDGRINKIMAG